MTANESTPGVLVNAPVKFAGATPGVIVTPAPPAGVPVEGLPQASFREVLRRDGSREGAVQAVVDPPLGGNYLNIALYVQGPRDTQWQLIERKPVAPADQNNPVYFNVFQSLLNDGVHRFMYEVESTSGNSGPSTESWALYHRDLPGGNDVPGTGAHPDLRISLPPELGNPPQIGKDEVDRGVPVTLSYPFMRAYDVITLELNRERFTFTVQPGDEGKPFVITVTRSMFERAGSHPEFPFSFTAVDHVNNPTHKRRWSSVIKANVNTERVTLTAPDLSENPDDPADDPETIDLGKVKDFLYVLVHVFSPLWAANDTIRMTYTCTPETGLPVTHTVEMPVTRLPFTHKLQVPVTKVLKGGAVSVIYEQVQGGKVIATSLPAKAPVIGESLVKLSAPLLVAPATNPIDLLKFLTGVKVRVEHLTDQNGGQAQLFEVNPPPDSPPFAVVTLNKNFRANFDLDAAFLSTHYGKEFRLRWRLIRGGEQIAQSGPLVLSVLRIADGDTRFPTPAIDGAVAGQLDVTKMQASDKLRIAAWWPQSSGTNTCWLQYAGVDINGRTTFDDLVGQPHDGGLPLIRPAPIGWLKTLKNGSSVTATFKIQIAEGATLVTFPICTYTIKAEALILPAITMVRDTSDRIISPGTETVARSVKLSGTAQEGAVVEIYDSGQLKGRVTATGGHWELPIAGLLVGDHIYSAKDTRGTSENWTIRVIAAVPPILVSITRQLGGSYPSGSRIPVTVSERGPIIFRVTCQALPYDRMIYINQINYGMSGVLVLAGSTSGVSPASTASIHPNMGRTEWTLRDTASDVLSVLPRYWNTVN
jgi:hypothetical protein